MNPLSNYIPPVQEPVLERGNDLDWDNLPGQPGDLNFRPAVTNSAETQRQLLCLLLLASFLSIPLGMIFRVFGHNLNSTVFFAIAFLIACFRGLVRARIPENDEQEQLREIIGSFAFPLQIWAMIALAHWTYSVAWSLAYLVILAMPLVFRLVDQFTTHTMHWFSADPSVSLATLNLWRKHWARRFDPAPSHSAAHADVGTPSPDDAVAIYWAGWKSVAGCFALGLIVVLFLTARDLPLYRVGLWFFVTIVAAMLAVCLINRRRPSFSQWWSLLIAWYGYGKDQRHPNWVFQSPSGDLLRRQHTLTSAIFLLALGCCFVTDHFSWLLTCDPALRELTQLGSSSTGVPRLDFSYFQRGAELAVFYFIITIMACAIVPVLFLILLAYVATGPLVFHLQHTLTNPRKSS